MKFRNRIAALFMALVLCFGAVTPAFAANERCVEVQSISDYQRFSDRERLPRNVHRAVHEDNQRLQLRDKAAHRSDTHPAEEFPVHA